jgi:TolB protein
MRRIRHAGIIALTLTLGLTAGAPGPAEATTPGSNGRIAWSRDGDVYTANPDGSAWMRVTATPGADTALWTPDGTRLVVIQWPSAEGRPFSLLITTSQGTEGRRVPLAVRGIMANPALSPDGTRLAFTDVDIANQHETTPYPSKIVVVDLASGAQRDLTAWGRGSGGGPSWSPDGRSIAFIRYTRLNADVWRMRSDGSGKVRLTRDGRNELDVAWSPDGSRLAFTRAIPAAGGPGEVGNELLTMAPDGSSMRTLMTGPFDRLPQWSPDGTRLLFIRERFEPEFAFETWVIDGDGSDAQFVATSDYDSVWSPDSTSIAFSLFPQLYVADVGGGAPVLVAAGPALNAQPSWQAVP